MMLSTRFINCKHNKSSLLTVRTCFFIDIFRLKIPCDESEKNFLLYSFTASALNSDLVYRLARVHRELFSRLKIRLNQRKIRLGFHEINGSNATRT